ncbi:MAG TPA: hypothetical protein VF374_07465 [Thermoplasmata archaeon]|jgi:hypothetical protein
MACGRVLTCVCAVVFVVALVHSSANASALERNDGDFWSYSVSVDISALDPSDLNITDMPIDLSGIEVTGEILYEFLGKDNISIDGTSHPVNVMAVSGYLEGSVGLIGLEASQTIQGHVFETSEGQGTVRDDLTLWTNLTWGVGSFAYLMKYESRLINIYAPPLMSGFDPGSIVLGGSWDETVQVRTIAINVTTGAVVSDTNSSVATHFVVAAETEEVSTQAGRFTAFEVTASEDEGTRVVYWWSEDVGNFVMQETYLGNGSEPAETMILRDYNNESSSGILVFVAIGAVALAVALIVLGLVLLKRRSRGVQPKPPPELLQLPPS